MEDTIKRIRLNIEVQGNPYVRTDEDDEGAFEFYDEERQRLSLRDAHLQLRELATAVLDEDEEQERDELLENYALTGSYADFTTHALFVRHVDRTRRPSGEICYYILWILYDLNIRPSLLAALNYIHCPKRNLKRPHEWLANIDVRLTTPRNAWSVVILLVWVTKTIADEQQWRSWLGEHYNLGSLSIVECDQVLNFLRRLSNDNLVPITLYLDVFFGVLASHSHPQDDLQRFDFIWGDDQILALIHPDVSELADQTKEKYAQAIFHYYNETRGDLIGYQLQDIVSALVLLNSQHPEAEPYYEGQPSEILIQILTPGPQLFETLMEYTAFVSSDETIHPLLFTPVPTASILWRNGVWVNLMLRQVQQYIGIDFAQHQDKRNDLVHAVNTLTSIRTFDISDESQQVLDRVCEIFPRECTDGLASWNKVRKLCVSMLEMKARMDILRPEKETMARDIETIPDVPDNLKDMAGTMAMVLNRDLPLLVSLVERFTGVESQHVLEFYNMVVARTLEEFAAGRAGGKAMEFDAYAAYDA